MNALRALYVLLLLTLTPSAAVSAWLVAAVPVYVPVLAVVASGP